MIDLQVNGLINDKCACNFWQNPSQKEIKSLENYLYEEGLKNFLATLITDSLENILENLKIISNFKSQILSGVHMEGGFISRMGVHPEKYSSTINIEAAKIICKKFPGLIKLWTLCPQKDIDGSLTKFLQDQGIAVSYGHSDASFEQAYKSFEKNHVDLVTHWGNAMKVADKFKQRATDEFSLKILEHEDPGSLSGSGIGLAALKHPKVKLMIIVGSNAYGDEHLDPLIVKKLAEIKKNQLILVSDSVAYSGPRPPDQLVGGLVSLKKHHQNALNIGLTQDDLDKSTELAAQIIQKA